MLLSKLEIGQRWQMRNDVATVVKVHGSKVIFQLQSSGLFVESSRSRFQEQTQLCISVPKLVKSEQNISSAKPGWILETVEGDYILLSNIRNKLRAVPTWLNSVDDFDNAETLSISEIQRKAGFRIKSSQSYLKNQQAIALGYIWNVKPYSAFGIFAKRETLDGEIIEKYLDAKQTVNFTPETSLIDFANMQEISDVLSMSISQENYGHLKLLKAFEEGLVNADS